MKNLLIYINPNKKFGSESRILVKVHIDNHDALGLPKDDFLLVTNFAYEYNGIKSLVVPDSLYCKFSPLSTNTFALAHLFEKGLIAQDIYWVHDFDAYQNNLIADSELDFPDAGFTDYGRSLEWNLGSFFFRESAADIFTTLTNTGYQKTMFDGMTLQYMLDNNIVNLKERIKRMNITYNFGMRRIQLCYEMATKPIRVLHFHPKNDLLEVSPDDMYGKDRKILDNLPIAMYGKNRLKMPLMSDSLIQVFQHHGLK